MFRKQVCVPVGTILSNYLMIFRMILEIDGIFVDFQRWTNCLRFNSQDTTDRTGMIQTTPRGRFRSTSLEARPYGLNSLNFMQQY